MAREIILLRTPRNSGKSTSITNLYNCVSDRCGTHQLCSEEYGSVDIRKCIRIEECNTIIGFASGGDDEKTVADNCRFFEKNNCSICVTACLTRGSTNYCIRAWAEEKGYGISLHDYIQFKSTHADNETEVWKQANEEKVRMMLARIEYLIDRSST